MYFHTDSLADLAALQNAVNAALVEGRSLRIEVSEGNLKYKVGEGMWTHSIASTPDPYRDATVECNHNCDTNLTHGPHEKHFLDCPVWGF
jgi:hypothetical protein